MADQAIGILSPWLRKKRIIIAKPFISGNVLDYGCGVGIIAEFCDPGSYTGVDIDEESLKIARINYPKYRFENYLPDGEEFDVIFLLAVIEHFKDPLNLLRNLKKRLKNKGKIVITTPKEVTQCMHRFGATLGLFSSSAKEEHEKFFNYKRMRAVAGEAGLTVSHYRSFLFCLNQLFILENS